MSDSNEQYFQKAIETLAQSDPIPKLLHEVKLGRMKPTDAGLRAITESWLETYQKVLANAPSPDPVVLARLDPNPRLDLLIAAGVVNGEQAGAVALRTTFERALAEARQRTGASG